MSSVLTPRIWRQEGSIYAINGQEKSSFVNIVIDVHFAGLSMPCAGLGKPGEHLPPKYWDQVMDELIKEKKVMEVLVSKVPKGSLNKKRIMRKAYRRNFCVDVPTSRAMDMTPPKAKRQRQCTKDLSRNAYMEQMSTDSFSGEDRSRLLMYNKLSSLPMQQKFRDC